MSKHCKKGFHGKSKIHEECRTLNLVLSENLKGFQDHIRSTLDTLAREKVEQIRVQNFNQQV